MIARQLPLSAIPMTPGRQTAAEVLAAQVQRSSDYPSYGAAGELVAAGKLAETLAESYPGLPSGEAVRTILAFAALHENPTKIEEVSSNPVLHAALGIVAGTVASALTQVGQTMPAQNGEGA